LTAAFSQEKLFDALTEDEKQVAHIKQQDAPTQQMMKPKTSRRSRWKAILLARNDVFNRIKQAGAQWETIDAAADR
jgi:hypothetical protein